MKKFVTRFVQDTRGQDLIEYGLLIGVITVATMTAVHAIGGKVATYFSNLNAKLP